MTVNILNYLNQENIFFSPRQKNKENTVSFMLDNLASGGKINKKNKKAILSAVLQREEMGSTAIGGNIALPHARINTVKDIVLSLCIVKEGVDFDSLDEAPVNIIVLLLSSKSQAGVHLKALAFLARMLRDKYFVQRLKKSSDKKEVIDLLAKQQQAVS